MRKASKRASDSPAFQWYAAEYLADENVALMTLEEEGAYIRALSYCWREGSIPSSPEMLSRLLKGASFETVQTVVQRFRTIETETGTRLVHGRLEKERRKQADWRRKSSEGGKLSGKTRRNKKLHAEPTLNGGSQMVEPNGNRPLEPNMNSSSSFSSSSSSSLSEPTDGPLPDSVDARILCEKLGMFNIRDQEAVHRLMRAHAAESGRTPAECIEYIRHRCFEYAQAIPQLEFQNGSVFKFLMSGWWDNPDAWPWKNGKKAAPPNPGAQKTREPTEAEARAMWESMSAEYRRKHPWRGAAEC